MITALKEGGALARRFDVPPNRIMDWEASVLVPIQRQEAKTNTLAGCMAVWGMVRQTGLLRSTVRPY